MRRVGQRSFQPQETTGPQVGVFLTPAGVTIRVVQSGERSTLPSATVKAEDDTKAAIAAAAREVAARLARHARRPIQVTIA